MSPPSGASPWNGIFGRVKRSKYNNTIQQFLLDVASPLSSAGSNELSCGCTFLMCWGILSMIIVCGPVIQVTQPVTNFHMHHLCGFFTQIVFTFLYWTNVASLCRSTTLISFTQILYKCIRLARHGKGGYIIPGWDDIGGISSLGGMILGYHPWVGWYPNIWSPWSGSSFMQQFVLLSHDTSL